LRDGQVKFRWRDSADKNKKRLLTLPVGEFLRRFLLHVLPRGFVRIRHFGFLASRRFRALLPLCKRALSADSPASHRSAIPHEGEVQPASQWCCPLCGAPMTLIERLTAVQIRLRTRHCPPSIRGDSPQKNYHNPSAASSID
jgi:Putative transposase